MTMAIQAPKERSLTDKVVAHPYRGFSLEFLLVGGFCFLAARRLNNQADVVEGELDYEDVQSLSFVRRILDMVINRNHGKGPPPDPPGPGERPGLRVVK